MLEWILNDQPEFSSLAPPHTPAFVYHESHVRRCEIALAGRRGAHRTGAGGASSQRGNRARLDSRRHAPLCLCRRQAACVRCWLTRPPSPLPGRCPRESPGWARPWRCSTPTRSSTTTCPLWTTTICAAASPPATRPSARPSPSWPATRCKPAPSRCSPASTHRPRPPSRSSASSPTPSAPSRA